MSIITWVENGIKQFAVFDSKYFDRADGNIPVYESRHRTIGQILSFSDDEVLLVSGDRKRYRILQPEAQKAPLPGSRPRPKRRKKIA